MITAGDARAISARNGYKAREELEWFEGKIEEAAKRGDRDALLCYCHCATGAQRAAMDMLRQRGFEVYTTAETLGGVRQAPAYYARW